MHKTIYSTTRKLALSKNNICTRHCHDGTKQRAQRCYESMPLNGRRSPNIAKLWQLSQIWHQYMLNL